MSGVTRARKAQEADEGASMSCIPPRRPGSIVDVASRYDNFIGGKWLAPTKAR